MSNIQTIEQTKGTKKITGKSRKKITKKLKKYKNTNRRPRKNLSNKICDKKMTVDKDKLVHAMELLKSTKIPHSKCKLPFYKSLSGNIYEDMSLLSYTNVAKYMRDCILTHNWNTLTRLLICFFDVKPVLNCIKWQTAFINLLYNPNANKHNMLNEFLHMCMSCQTESEKRKFLQRLLTINEENNNSIDQCDELKDEVKSDEDDDTCVDFEKLFSELIH